MLYVSSQEQFAFTPDIGLLHAAMAHHRIPCETSVDGCQMAIAHHIVNGSRAERSVQYDIALAPMRVVVLLDLSSNVKNQTSISTFFDGFDRRSKATLVTLAAAHGIKTDSTETVEQIRGSITHHIGQGQSSQFKQVLVWEPGEHLGLAIPDKI
jgi:hypothetical protein